MTATANSIETRTRLNEMVAEKIFGEPRPPEKKSGGSLGQAYETSIGHCWSTQTLGGFGRSEWSKWRVADFSGDIAQAWRVVEKLQQQNYLMTVNVYRRFYCEIYFDNHYFCAARDTAPEAICRAALAAVGCEVPE